MNIINPGGSSYRHIMIKETTRFDTAQLQSSNTMLVPVITGRNKLSTYFVYYLFALLKYYLAEETFLNFAFKNEKKTGEVLPYNNTIQNCAPLLVSNADSNGI